MSARQQLQEWLYQRRFRPKHLRWERIVRENDPLQDGTWMRVIFATTKNNYYLTFKDTYLGLTVSSRITRPGERWLRGNDLHDGSFSEETLDGALEDVLHYELREVSDVPGGGGEWELEDESEGVMDTSEPVTPPYFEAGVTVPDNRLYTSRICFHGKGGRACDDICACACHTEGSD